MRERERARESERESERERRERERERAREREVLETSRERSFVYGSVGRVSRTYFIIGINSLYMKVCSPSVGTTIPH